MVIFDFFNYKDFIHHHIENLPKSGRGEFRKIATSLRMHTTLVSQVFSGDKHLTLDQAFDLCKLYGFTDLETEYFLAMVTKERAAQQNLQKYFEQRLEQIRKQAKEIKNRLPTGKTLTERDRAIFYSHWYYSAVRQVCALPDCHTPEIIAKRLNLSVERVREALQFLVGIGLCEIDDKGAYSPTEARTHVEKTSPLVGRHHINWRLKAIEKMNKHGPQELAFTAPLTIHKKDTDKIYKKILELVDTMSAVVRETDPQELYCLNVDWFQVSEE